MSLPQMFGLVPTGSPVVVTPASSPSPTSFLYTLPARRSFSHIVVFLLPGVALPPNTAAAVYMARPAAPTDFRFLGAIGDGKESAVFKISAPPQPDGASPDLIIGINVESADLVAQQLAATQTTTNTNTPAAQALVVAGRPPPPTTTLLLAQRIIKNAFNFLASFSGNVPVPGGDGVAGVEVVPLKAFEDWWKKFETKVRNDPSFLERDVD